MASIVFSMCRMLFEAVQKQTSYSGGKSTLEVLRSILHLPNFYPKSAEDIAQEVLVTCFMGTKNSSKETRSRAKALAG